MRAILKVMGKLIERLNFFKYIFSKKYELFYILDFGRSSIKAAILEINKPTKKAKLLRAVEEIYTHHIGAAEHVEHVEQVVAMFKKTLEKLKLEKKKHPKRLVIGLASEMVYGHNFTYVYKRENPEAKVDLRELKNAIHKTELKAYEDIRKKFVLESGYSETEVVLINSVIQEIRVDGYRVANPLGFEGEEILVSVFNAYLPQFYKKLFEDVAQEMKFSLEFLIYEPYAMFNVLREKAEEEFEAIIIDIGGKTTRISSARKNKLEEVKTFSFGGESFTKRIASHFEIGFWEAENIKIRYSKNDLSEHAKAIISEILQREFEIFLGAMEMILKEFSRATLLPDKIYVHGGGGNVPIIDDIIRKRRWKRELSFLKSPKIYRLEPSQFDSIEIVNSQIESQQLVSILALGEYLICLSAEKDTLIAKTLSRMAKLIQDQ